MEENDGTEDVFTAWPEDWNYSRHIKQLDVRVFVIYISITNKDNNRYVKILHNMLINDNFKAHSKDKIR